MFKYWKEMRELNKSNKEYMNFILQSACEVILEFKAAKQEADESQVTNKEALEIMNKLKGLDQKEMINVLVDAIKSKEKAE